jgi:apolipoprotein N-acyltransferase
MMKPRSESFSLHVVRGLSGRLWAFAFVSALLQLLPFPLAGPVPIWRRSLCWICLVPLLAALTGEESRKKAVSVRQAAVLGYGCGVAWFLGNCYWIYQTMFRYGGLPELASAGILVLFSLYLGIYFGAFGAFVAWVRKLQGRQAAIAMAPLIWVAVELARARVTGFPWDLLGYTQVDNSWLTPIAPVTGVMGLSLLVAAGNAAWLWRPSPRLWFVGPLLGLLLTGIGLGGMFRKPAVEKASASAVLLQDNLSVGAEGRYAPETEPEMLGSFANLTLHPELATDASEAGVVTPSTSSLPLELIAWPEAPTPFLDADHDLRRIVGQIARAAKAPLVLQAEGAATTPNAAGHFDQYVSASFFLPDGSYAGRYDKMHLVPFGEYTPYKKLFFFAGHLLDQLVLVPGTQRRTFAVNGHRFGVFICYESIFGDEVREFAEDGAQVLVNLSDDGWYGDTSAPWEHLDMARMRAIENRRWLLRDTNTGLTGSIDPEGRIVAALPRHVRDAIEVPFGYRSDLTFYTRHGDWIAWLCAIATVSVLAGGALQRRYPREQGRAG